jgi:hypothetical protein
MVQRPKLTRAAKERPHVDWSSCRSNSDVYRTQFRVGEKTESNPHGADEWYCGVHSHGTAPLETELGKIKAVFFANQRSPAGQQTRGAEGPRASILA